MPNTIDRDTIETAPGFARQSHSGRLLPQANVGLGEPFFLDALRPVLYFIFSVHFRRKAMRDAETKSAAELEAKGELFDHVIKPSPREGAKLPSKVEDDHEET